MNSPSSTAAGRNEVDALFAQFKPVAGGAYGLACAVVSCILLCALLTAQTAEPAAVVDWSIHRRSGPSPAAHLPPPVAAIHADPSPAPTRRVLSIAKTEIWLRTLSGGALAVAAFNRTAHPIQADLVWTELAIAGQPHVLDALGNRDLGRVHGGFAVKLPPGGAALFRVQPPAIATPARSKENRQ